MRGALALALVTVWAAVGCDPRSAGSPDAAAAVTDANLLESERFWPYQVALARDGSLGVLIRVEEGAIARIDFGRDGIFFCLPSFAGSASATIWPPGAANACAR